MEDQMVQQDSSKSLRTIEPAYKSTSDIVKWHGIFVYAGYLVLFYLGNFSFIRWWFRFGKWKWIAKYARDMTGKTKPWWQDIGVLITMSFTVGIVWVAVRTPFSPWLAGAAWYFLFDMVSYHARVLWFDTLEPGKTADALKVFSHTRVLFHTFLNFGQSIFLFGILHHYYASPPDGAGLYQASFELATTLTKPAELSGSPAWLITAHVLVSMFFLVVVISTVAAIGYRRGELAPNPSAEHISQIEDPTEQLTPRTEF